MSRCHFVIMSLLYEFSRVTTNQAKTNYTITKTNTL